jgi:diguanylate cyclase (GGDEF)-like protein
LLKWEEQRMEQLKPLFENVPIALLDKDYSMLRAHLLNLKVAGINLREYFTENNHEVYNCIKLIKINNVNSYALALFKAGNKLEFQENFQMLVGIGKDKTSLRNLINKMLAVADGQNTFEYSLRSFTMQGDTLDLVYNYSVIPNIDDFSIVLESVVDVTGFKKAEEAMAFSATHDHLTHLPNRVLFDESLKSAIYRVKRTKQPMALLYLDLDNFKTINDNFGHEIGDLLLIEVSKRMQLLIREDDLAARIGGDEFAIILNRCSKRTDIDEVASRLLIFIASPYKIHAYDIHITVSIGITLCPERGTSPTELTRNADAALYKAKVFGKNTFRYL